MQFDQFIRAISLNPRKKVSFFLGAGTSVESGVLSAADCIWEWKKNIYDTNNAHSPFVLLTLRLMLAKKQFKNG
jgi:NAD-dependent SIR2 family protein deacetylase